jgi:hypothetical protein
MLLPVILVVLWFTVMLVFVAVCRMAARGDCAFPATVDHSMIGWPEYSLGSELIISERRADRLGERAAI